MIDFHSIDGSNECMKRLNRKYNDLLTCRQFFDKIISESNNIKVWRNVYRYANGRQELISSYFMSEWQIKKASEKYHIVLGYQKKGYYSKYYIVDSMYCLYYEMYRNDIETLNLALEQQRQFVKEIEAQNRLYGKQYNMFGGMD